MGTKRQWGRVQFEQIDDAELVNSSQRAGVVVLYYQPRKKQNTLKYANEFRVFSVFRGEFVTAAEWVNASGVSLEVKTLFTDCSDSFEATKRDFTALGLGAKYCIGPPTSGLDVVNQSIPRALPWADIAPTLRAYSSLLSVLFFLLSSVFGLIFGSAV